MKSAFDRIYAREHRDVKAPDGVLAHGWRWVRAPGRLKFAGTWFSHEKLAPYVGQHVLVYAADTNILTVEVSEDHSKPIVTITVK